MHDQIEQQLSRGDFAGATALAETALRAAPDDPRLNLLAGRALLAQGEAESALDYIHLALHYAPHLEEALTVRVLALERSGRLAQVDAAYREFLDCNPDHAGATLGLALDLRRRGDFDQAASLLEALIESNPRAGDALGLLGLIKAREFGQLDEGEDLVRRALAIDPQSMAAQSNLGWILVLQRRYAEGLRCLDDVIERHPENHETRLMRAYAHLRRGEFALGWRDIEARHHSRLATARQFEYPRWSGKTIDGGTLLVNAEQGLGDQIMYASCIPDAIAGLGGSGRVIIECDPRLVGLFERSFASAIVVPHRPDSSRPGPFDDLGRIDCGIPSGSLPSLYRKAWRDFPDRAGYLRADPEKIAAWRRRLDRLSPLPKIGISWRGGSPQTRRRLRSISLESLLPLLRLPAAFVSLQYGEVQSEIEQLNRTLAAPMHVFRLSPADYDDTAGLVGALDLVVSVCTAVVHLAGALGKRTWVLAPAVPEWRYLDEGEAMPWYPSVRMVRQERVESWDPAIQRLAILIQRSLESMASLRE